MQAFCYIFIISSHGDIIKVIFPDFTKLQSHKTHQCFTEPNPIVTSMAFTTILKSWYGVYSASVFPDKTSHCMLHLLDNVCLYFANTWVFATIHSPYFLF